MSIHHVEPVMGTVISIDLVGSHDRDLLARVVHWFHSVDDVFSPYKESSIITAIGRGRVALDHPAVGNDVHDVLARCEALRVRTDGVFDVWRLPSPNGTSFDPCGYVKGWSVQAAADMVTDAGVSDFCINAGGDVAVAGRNHDGQPWRVGVRHPHDPGALAFVVLTERPLAIATSGTYERGAHIVDPRTGERCAEIASVTVVGRDLGEVDGLATAVFAMGLGGIDWLSQQPDVEGCAITHDLRVLATPGFGRHLASTVAVCPSSSSS